LSEWSYDSFKLAKIILHDRVIAYKLTLIFL